ncbi:unnamed protein product [Ostreobium quekettii]|uniref:Uncharacterized protein n=1 Tax=Ostreobium quekettii TaxID=121088 RepID=A0A8S1IXV8_9CHLO|nr:unnamed protein product [Ostreobium quekettii]
MEGKRLPCIPVGGLRVRRAPAAAMPMPIILSGQQGGGARFLRCGIISGTDVRTLTSNRWVGLASHACPAPGVDTGLSANRPADVGGEGLIASTPPPKSMPAALKSMCLFDNFGGVDRVGRVIDLDG